MSLDTDLKYAHAMEWVSTVMDAERVLTLVSMGRSSEVTQEEYEQILDRLHLLSAYLTDSLGAVIEEQTNAALRGGVRRSASFHFQSPSSPEPVQEPLPPTEDEKGAVGAPERTSEGVLRSFGRGFRRGLGHWF
jgi:hypothetical protein